MNDQELRALVRESIAKQLGRWGDPSGAAEQRPGLPSMVDPRLHASHGVYMIPGSDGPAGPSGDVDGPCIIEPSVACTHCNYCKSHGH